MTTADAHIAAVVTAASIVNPQGGESFDGDFAEALAAMVRWAETERCDDPVAWRGKVAKRLANSDHDRVAEVCAGALLRLVELGDVRRATAIEIGGRIGEALRLHPTADGLAFALGGIIGDYAKEG